MAIFGVSWRWLPELIQVSMGDGEADISAGAVLRKNSMLDKESRLWTATIDSEDDTRNLDLLFLYAANLACAHRSHGLCVRARRGIINNYLSSECCAFELVASGLIDFNINFVRPLQKQRYPFDLSLGCSSVSKLCVQQRAKAAHSGVPAEITCGSTEGWLPNCSSSLYRFLPETVQPSSAEPY